jgi:hypothetical protein
MNPKDEMYPTDDWLELLNFYLIVNSGGQLTVSDFDDARLYQAYQQNPGQRLADMDATATKLVLEFQAQTQDTEIKTSPSGETEETPNGPLPISVLDLPG